MPLTQEKIKQLPVDDLLDRIIEESAEVIQAASKFKRFGHDAYNPFIKDAPLNIDALGLEYTQLSIYIDELFSRFGWKNVIEMYSDTIEQDAEEQEKKYVELGITPGT